MALSISAASPHEFRRIRVQECRLSQEELAEALGVTQQTISRYERGTYPIPVMAALALEALAVRPRQKVREEMGWETPVRRKGWRRITTAIKLGESS